MHSITRDGIEQFRENHDGHSPDLVTHIGMAKGRNFYCAETFARREGYKIADVDEKKATGYEELFRSKGYPEILRPGDLPRAGINAGPDSVSQSILNPTNLDDKLLETWKSFAKEGEDLRLSIDAGRYLCEFILYNSLVHAWEEGRKLSVVFMHVPGWDSPEDIQRGTEAAIALIKSLVTCWATPKS